MQSKDKNNIEISQLSSKKNETVCAVVVTYNRKQLLLECLEALKRQTRPIDAIYIIDNASTDNTPKILLENKYIPKLPPSDLIESWEISSSILSAQTQTNKSQTLITIHYVRMHENTGGAGGFHEGVKRGYEKGYDWLWLMDDDAEPKEDALEKLSKYFNIEGLSALAPTVIDKKGNVSLLHRGLLGFNSMLPLPQNPLPLKEYSKKYINIDFASFVGILVFKNAVEKIGFPNKLFFIYADDVEYSIRLRQYGKMYLITESVIYHKEMSKENNIKRSFLWKNSSRLPLRKFLFLYYSSRNLIYLSKKYTKNNFILYFDLLVELLRKIKILVGIILFDDYKWARIKIVLLSYYDGFVGNFSRDVKKILNL